MGGIASRAPAVEGCSEYLESAYAMPSAVICAYAYDRPTRTLAVTFASGRRYRYHDVPEETFVAMQAAFAKGEFFNKVIRPRFRFTCEG